MQIYQLVFVFEVVLLHQNPFQNFKKNLSLACERCRLETDSPERLELLLVIHILANKVI